MLFNKKVSLFLITIFLISHYTVFSESLKSYADFYFSTKTWTNPLSEQREIKPTVVPGGAESFSYLKLENDITDSVIFPYCHGLGVLNYSDLDGALLDLCVAFKNQLLDRRIDKTLCNPDYPYISTIAQYQLEKLPLLNTVIFSTATQDSSNEYVVKFKIGKFQNNEFPYIFLEIKMILKDTIFVIQEIEFEWDAYVANSR